MSLNIRGFRTVWARLVGGAAAAALCVTAATVVASAQGPAQARPPAFDVPEHPSRMVVMELFSSQNCGNCPEANKNIETLARRSDVIAITYPVGYWDYLGWNDTFAKAKFGDRQTRYNRVLGHRGPYTPQVIYSGRLHGSGVDLEGIGRAFARRDVTPYPVAVKFAGDEVIVTGEKAESAASITVVKFKPGLTKVTPGGGANKGKSMTYHNLVTDFGIVGAFDGGEKRYRVRCEEGCIVMVQEGGAEGSVLGVAQKK